MSKATQRKKKEKEKKVLKEQEKKILFQKLEDIDEFELFDFRKGQLYFLDPKKNYSFDFYFLSKKEENDLGKKYIEKYPEHKNSQLVSLTIGFYCEDEINRELKEIKNLLNYDGDVDSESYITSYKNLKDWIRRKILEGKLYKEI